MGPNFRRIYDVRSYLLANSDQIRHCITHVRRSVMPYTAHCKMRGAVRFTLQVPLLASLIGVMSSTNSAQKQSTETSWIRRLHCGCIIRVKIVNSLLRLLTWLWDMMAETLASDSRRKTEWRPFTFRSRSGCRECKVRLASAGLC